MKLPDNIFGINTKKAYEDYLDRAKSKKEPKKQAVSPLEFKANINPEEFVQTSFGDLISKYEPDYSKNNNYEDTHKLVLEKGLFIPRPNLFIPHFLNVINAYNGKNKLYDGNGNILSEKEIEDMYKHLTTNHINNGAWSWLNSKFVEGTGLNDLDIEYITGLNSNGDLITTKEPLEACLMKDCYASLEFNKQGLAIKKLKKQEYEQGKNIYFYYPRENAVARFYADSDRVGLFCFRNPGYSGSSLGVFVCAEGTPKNLK